MKVSVLMLVYNHEKFIEKALLGVLAQKVDFEYEIIVSDDCSQDATFRIVQEIKNRHDAGNVIKYVRHKRNVGVAANFILALTMCQGEYIAHCEGDDYWDHNEKLKMQVDFLDNNDDYSAVTSFTKILSSNEGLIIEPVPIKLVVSFEDILLDRKNQTRTVSLVMRNFKTHLEAFAVKGVYFGVDRKLKLWLTKDGKNIKILPVLTAVYRIHSGGVWSLAAREKKRAAKQNDYLETHRHFSMPFLLKVRFVWHHFAKTIPGDLRYGRIRFLWQTLMALFILPQKKESLAK